VSSTNWYALRFNGTEVGEVGINAALCGTWDCPVALVTGDDVVCSESRALLGPGLRTLAVKQGLGRFSARHRTPAWARREIEDAARNAVAALAAGETARAVYDPGAPCTIEVDLGAPDSAEPYAHRANVTISDGRRLTSTAPTWLEAWRQFYV
jgi:D-amino peptidase